ncbi:hypothetical protein [Cypionkella sinensis]|uniref:Uncharacterized protein n=1 Tax=Cypionkella sinensis TaxID=1756043 RepID=A0ABV7J2I5_9RHOB
MTEATFRARLVALGLTLDDKAFAAAWAGAQHLRAEIARVEKWLASQL